jgi:hypothetical protein
MALWQILHPSNFLCVQGADIGLITSTSPLIFTRVVDATTAAAQLKTINDALELCTYWDGRNTNSFAKSFARTLVTNIGKKASNKYSGNVLKHFQDYQQFLQMWLKEHVS